MPSAELLAQLKLHDFVVIDFETTGLSPETSAIIEMAAVRFRDGRQEEEYQQLVNPQRPIPREIVDLTNITDDMVAEEPTIEEVGRGFLDFIAESPLVGQNISFDLAFLGNLRRSLGIGEDAESTLYDTLPLARTFIFHHNSFNLTALSEFYALAHQDAHRAFSDAYRTGIIFLRLIDEAASYPLPVLKTLLGVQDHVRIPNKQLYERLVGIMAATGQVKGLTRSTVEHASPTAVLEHPGKGDGFSPVTAEAFFGAGGLLGSKWEAFESRPVQEEFSQAVAEAFEEGQVLVAEAGTGLGKSMAYLLPAINHAHRHEQPVVVSCHTKHLQDQLFGIEIPRMVELLDAPLKAVKLKGRRNYLCRTRLEFVLANARRLLSPTDCEHILPIIVWDQFTRTGDIDECPGFSRRHNGQVWRLLRSERGYCLGTSCRRQHGCFVGPLRRAVKDADLVVVNHALLIADAAGEVGLLPENFRLVIDEAHNLEKVTTEQLTMEFGEAVVGGLTDRYLSSRHRQIYRQRLKDAVQAMSGSDDLYQRLKGAARQLKQATAALSEAYVHKHQLAIQPGTQGRGPGGATEYRVQQTRYVDPRVEFHGVEPAVADTAGALEAFIELLASANELVSKSDMALPEALRFECEGDLAEARALALALDRSAIKEPSGAEILWREIRYPFSDRAGHKLQSAAKRTLPKVAFKNTPLEIGSFLSSALFQERPGCVLCSATLQTAGGFDYFLTAVGLDKRFDAAPVRKEAFHSPFFYEEQCSVLAWQTPVDVTDQHYSRALADLIYELTDQVHGRMLVLFTSYAQVRAVSDLLYPRLFRSDRRLLTQRGLSSRWSLLEGFKHSRRSILLGTASFWEGVDLPGDLLELLIVARLPFANPTDPVVEARIETIQLEGRNPFLEYQVPDAITRFRQGFGRLIRTSYDQGIFIVADSRVLRRQYGHMFMDALPVQAETFQAVEQLIGLAERRGFRSQKGVTKELKAP